MAPSFRLTSTECLCNLADVPAISSMKHSVALPGHHAPAAGFEAPFDMLTACHERVQRTLALMSRLQQHVLTHGQDESARQAARDVMRYFDLAAPLHHQDEELHVFPPLMAGNDPALRAVVERLMADHRKMETAWSAARMALAGVAESSPQAWLPLTPEQTRALDQFASLYNRHIEDEEHLVYPAAQAGLSVSALQAMSGDMMARRGVKIKT
jgi:hemerythrin-like domain-containing protein